MERRVVLNMEVDTPLEADLIARGFSRATIARRLPGPASTARDYRHEPLPKKRIKSRYGTARPAREWMNEPIIMWRNQPSMRHRGNFLIFSLRRFGECVRYVNLTWNRPYRLANRKSRRDLRLLSKPPLLHRFPSSRDRCRSRQSCRVKTDLSAEMLVGLLSAKLQGWANYFDLGAVNRACRALATT